MGSVFALDGAATTVRRGGGVKNKATIIHHSSGQLVRLSGNEIFGTVTESVLKPSAQKAKNHFCVFLYIYFSYAWMERRR